MSCPPVRPERCWVSRELGYRSPDPSAIAQALLDWYHQHGRDLPWRGPDVSPYEVLVAEVMLQQTQVATVRRYYERFLNRFPTLHALAQASESDVLHVWQGLGYYSRARNLHRAAQAVSAQFDGRLPADERALRQLPGLGPYTARAVLAFAFGHPVLPVDANVARVLARVWAIRAPVQQASTRRLLEKLGDELAASAGSAELGHAAMDLGATVCLPRQPRCSQCPLQEQCLAARAGLTEQIPAGRKRDPVEHRSEWAAIVFDRCGRVLLLRRKQQQRWGGLWEFLRFPRSDGQSDELVPAMLQELGLEVERWRVARPFTYHVTRYRVRVQPWGGRYRTGHLQLGPEHDRAQWVATDELDHYPLSSPQRRVATLVVRWARELSYG